MCQLQLLPLRPVAGAAGVLSPCTTRSHPDCPLRLVTCGATGALWTGVGWTANCQGACRCGSAGRREFCVVGASPHRGLCTRGQNPLLCSPRRVTWQPSRMSKATVQRAAAMGDVWTCYNWLRQSGSGVAAARAKWPLRVFEAITPTAATGQGSRGSNMPLTGQQCQGF